MQEYQESELRQKRLGFQLIKLSLHAQHKNAVPSWVHFRVGRPGGPGAHKVAQSFEHWLTLKLWDASPITPPLSGHLINWSLKEPPYLQRPTAGWRKRGLWLWKHLPWLVLLLSFSWSRRYKWVKGGENRKKNVKFYSCKSIHRQ